MFEKELEWIKNENIKKLAEKAISMLPDYFFEVAASSTGKYHPNYALGSGGLVRHTKVATYIANELLALEMNDFYSQDEKDLIIVALILHDGWKHGENYSTFTVAEHPKVMSDWIMSNNKLNEMLPKEQIEMLCNAISSHMGQWNTSFKSKQEILPKPETDMEKFVHLADYLASRKYLPFDFNGDYYNPKDFVTNELGETILKIVEKCKEKISNGCIRDDIYNLIADKNDGKKNPNSISNIEIAKNILGCIEKMEGKVDG